MRKAGFILYLIILAGLTTGCYRPSPREAFDDLKALEGQWESTGTTLFNENWQVVSDTLMRGLGYSMNGKDTAYREHLKIFRIDNIIWYAAQPDPGKDYVLFKLENAGYRKWTFKNPENEYPAIIRYRLKKDTILETSIANIRGNKEVIFKFKKILP